METQKQTSSHIIPLFWQHGNDEKTIRNEIKQMNRMGIRAFVVESRSHPAFLGEQWWRDTDIILSEAKKRDMKVWFFDDSHYPSGYAAGIVAQEHPEYLKVYLDERHIDAMGPLHGSSFILKAWIAQGEELIAAIAAKRVDHNHTIDGTSLTDLTGEVKDGILYWDVPDGDWRIFMMIRTREGGEDGTRDYVNPIVPEPVKAYIDAVYERFYQRYADAFGKSIAGFFSDEPRFGNACTYDGKLGFFNADAPHTPQGAIHRMVLPYSDHLLAQLEEKWGDGFQRYLPCLWYNAGELTRQVRYTYMDVVSRLFGECYASQIGDWCRRHGVKYIGHVIEDNGAHARLGYGAGHFFRAVKGQDYSGFDIVYQVLPGYTTGCFTTPLGYLDAEFFYWGLAKMASSAGHLNPMNQGTTLCEIFGAYGWQEGLKLMKWLTDHVCVRGTNVLVPHAFSPKFPDPDCPPHFYAQGGNPQWKYFGIWSAYAGTVCKLLSNGVHSAPVAVLYHAEAEWAGDSMPFEQVVKALLQRQIDCDIVPIDMMMDIASADVSNGCFSIANETFHMLIIPYAEYLPAEFLKKLLEQAANGIAIVFIQNYPKGTSIHRDDSEQIINAIQEADTVYVRSLADLTAFLTALGIIDVITDGVEESLRCYHYMTKDNDAYFVTNESTTHKIDTKVRFTAQGQPVAYDAMTDQQYCLNYQRNGDSAIVDLILHPYESLFILFQKDSAPAPTQKRITGKYGSGFVIDTAWTVCCMEPADVQMFTLDKLRNVAVPGLLPEFSGTLRYETEFDYPSPVVSGAKTILDLGAVYEIAEVWCNGHPAGARICPPYFFDVSDSIVSGRNTMRIDVTNTLAKRLGNNVFDRAMPQEPSGLIGPVEIYTAEE